MFVTPASHLGEQDLNELLRPQQQIWCRQSYLSVRSHPPDAEHGHEGDKRANNTDYYGTITINKSMEYRQNLTSSYACPHMH